MFFVSVASKGLSFGVSLLFATLAGRCVSVAAKGVRGGTEVPRLPMVARDSHPGRMLVFVKD